MKNPYFAKRLKHFLLIFFFSSCIIYSQEKDIIANYKSYTEAPREVVYLHLNKSTYVKGEDIGFTAYVFNKQNKKPSLITTNLYVSLEDENNNIAEQALLKVEDGVASNVITIDSTYALGNYTIKAYTNWMRNFNGQGAFVEAIKIVEPNVKSATNTTAVNEKIDAQFLPEGGHLLHNVVNNVGVVIKDSKGYGLSNVTGKVFDKNDQIITEFKVNHLGIGRFLLFAESDNNYYIKIKHLKNEYHFNLDAKVEHIGVTLSVVNHRNKAIVTLITNDESLAKIKGKPYSLALHNGKKIGLVDVMFNDKTTEVKVFDLSTLPSGTNMITLFNEKNQPLVERLFFNYNGINTLQSQNVTVKKSNDSIELKLNYKHIDPSSFNNLSISALPQETKSYKHNHNIISHTFLKPYVKGHIEQPKYYFTDINEEKKLELDNLLITQGWSSYDWNNIFNNPNVYDHPFEQGITVKANFTLKSLNKNGDPSYVMYYINDDEDFMISESEKGKTNYWLDSLFPEEDNTIKLSEVTNKNKLEPSNLYLQFFPRQIPKLTHPNATLFDIIEQQSETKEQVENSNVVIKPLKNVTALDKVIVKSNPAVVKRERENQLSRGRFGKVSVVTEEDENTFIKLWPYLAWKAWNVGAHGPNASINISTNESYTTSSGRSASPGVNYFLNDFLLLDLSRLDELFLSDVDYIEVNRFGIGDGVRSPNGFIKIYTKNLARPRKPNNIAKEYGFPLTFSKQKQFYIPKYRYYNDEFYKRYGTIDWKPNLKVDSAGNISLKIAQPEVPITLFIEGIANDGAFVFEERSILLNKG